MRLHTDLFSRVLLLAGLSLVTAGNAQAGPQGDSGSAVLKIERNATGTLSQYIPLIGWEHDTDAGTLTAQTAGGDRLCGSISKRSGTGSNQLVLDGFSYPINRIEVSRTGRTMVVVNAASSGLFPMCTASLTRGSLKSTNAIEGATRSMVAGGGLEFAIDVLNDSGSVVTEILPVIGNINYNFSSNPRLLSINLAEDVLCLESLTTPGTRLALEDSNSVITHYTGMELLSYFPSPSGSVNSLTFLASTGSNIQCFTPQAVPEVVTTSAAPFSCAPSSNIFSDSFETGGVGGGSSEDNLQLDFRLINHPNTTTGSNAIYQLSVLNCSPGPMSDVIVRDLYPILDPGNPTMTGNSSWSCISGASCSGTGYIDVDLGTLAAGQQVVIEADRPLQTGSAGQFITIDAVAFPVGGSDNNVSNNLGSWTFDIRDNILPEVTVTGSADALIEDQGLVTITGVTVSASDDDGTVTAVSVSSNDPSVVTINNVDDSDLNNIIITVQTIADANGPVDLSVVATDNLGGDSLPALVGLDLTAVNDPPQITVAGGFDYSALSVVPDPVSFTGPCDQDSLPGCASQIFPSSVGPYQAGSKSGFTNWVVSISPGAANEGDQLANLTMSINDPTTSPGIFIGQSFEPALIDTGNGWTLDYGLSGSSGAEVMTITVDDGESSNNLTTFEFTISVDNTPPVVTVAGNPDVIDEDSSATVLDGSGFTISASDADGTIANVMVTSTDQAVIADGNIVVDDSNPADVQVTVTPEADVFGAVDLTVVAIDDVGNPSAPVQITLVINPVNDQPSVIFGDEASIEANSVVVDYEPLTDTLTLDNSDVTPSIQFIIELNGDAVLGPFEGDGSQTIISSAVSINDNASGVLDAAEPPEINIFGTAPNQIAVLNMRLSSGSAVGAASIDITITDSAGGNDTSTITTLNLIVVD